MSVVKWLEHGIDLALKERESVKKEIDDLWQLVPLAQMDIKKHLSISTDERMKKNDELTDKLIEIDMDIEKLNIILYCQQREDK